MQHATTPWSLLVHSTDTFEGQILGTNIHAGVSTTLSSEFNLSLFTEYSQWTDRHQVSPP